MSTSQTYFYYHGVPESRQLCEDQYVFTRGIVNLTRNVANVHHLNGVAYKTTGHW
jgi:hypothetical protein